MKVFDYVTKNTEAVINMNIRDLSEKSFVSTATIIRFCKKMDCNGYSEFKAKLKIFYNNSAKYDPETGIKAILDFFQNVGSKEFLDSISNACDLIKGKEITFFGIGTSGSLAEYGARYFSNLGYYALSTADPFYPPRLDNNKNHVFIVLSERGETLEVIDQVRLYKQLGSTVIAISNHQQSTIAKMSDLCISYYVKDIILPQAYTLSTQVPVIYILETMGKELARRERKPMPIYNSSKSSDEPHVSLPEEYMKNRNKNDDE